MAVLTVGAAMATGREAMLSIRAAVVAWPAPLPWQRAAAEQGCGYSWASRGRLPKPCQRVAASRSARARRREGAKLSHASKAVLCYTLHTAASVYIKPFFVFLSRKNAANRWKQTCLSRRVSRRLT